MAVVPIYNPPVPYLGYIDGGFGPGRMVRIQGSISPSAQRFAVNLQCGPNTNARDDIALYLSPRFNENFIMRSSLQNQSWIGEETHGSIPLARGQPFEVLILCESSSYKIALNNQHFAEYMHRLPYTRVSHLTIDGDVTLSLIAFEGGFAPPPMTGNGVPGYAPQPPMHGMAPPMPGAAPYPPGHMPPYGAQTMYGGAPYAPPPGPQQYGGYGGYGGYGQPPPPPGYQPEKSSGGFLDKAGMALAGALGGAGIMGALGGKYPTIPQGHGHGDSGQGGLGSGSIGNLGSLGTLIGTGLAGAALSGVLGGKDGSSSTDNKPKNPPQTTPSSQGNASQGSSGGLGYLGSLISPGLAGAIQQGLMGQGGHNPPVQDRRYQNPYPSPNPADASGGGLGSLGSLIGSGLAGAISSGLMGNQDRSNQYDRRSPNPYGGYGGHGGPGNYPGAQGNYGGGQAGGLGSLGSLIGSGLAGAIQSGFMGGGGGGKERSDRASLAYSTQHDKKTDDKSHGKIDEDLIRSLDELIVGPDDKPLNKTVIKLSDEAPIKSKDSTDVESEIGVSRKAVDEAEVSPVEKSFLESLEDQIEKVDVKPKAKAKKDDDDDEKAEGEPKLKPVEEPMTKTVIKAED